jgi:hypothetical protein
MSRSQRRALLALVVLVVLALCASVATASNGVHDPVNAPEWWYHPEWEPTYLRAGWWNWDRWDEDQGAIPDRWDINFKVHPTYSAKPWEWSHKAREGGGEYVTPGQGITILPGYSDWEIDMIMGNRQLHPWKKWYVEFTLTADNPEDLTKWIAGGGFQTEWFGMKHEGGVWKELGVDIGTAEVIQTGWVENTWYGEYYFAPQPDMEKINWTFITITDPPMEGNLYMSEMHFGTTCSPEPVTMVLLALGLPVGLLARRRRKED